MAAVIPHASEAFAPAVKPLRIVAMLAITAGVALAFWPAATSLALLWVDIHRTTYAHGFLVLATSAWLLWRLRDQWGAPDEQTSRRTRVVFLALLGGAVLAWQLTYRAGVQIGIETLMFVIVWLAIGALLGVCAARACLVPVAFLGFGLSLWDAINPVLHWATVQVARLLLRMFGVPAFFEGDLVHIPAGTFEIQGGCSGLHFMIVALALATLIGELRADSWRRRAQWLALAAILALLVNWIRVTSIILMGHLSQMQAYVVRESHYGYGWFLFAIAVALLLYIERRVPMTPSSPTHRSASQDAAPLNGLWISAVLLLIALPASLNAIVDRRARPGDDAIVAGGSVAGWSRAEIRSAEWQPRQLNADREGRMAFARGTQHIERFVAEYFDQQPGKKLGGYANRPQGDASLIDSGRDAAGDRVVKTMRLEQNHRQSLLWVTYRVDGRSFADPIRAQLWYAWRALRTLSTPPSIVVAWWAPCEPDCAAARVALQDFTAADGGMP
jgi:exosortase